MSHVPDLALERRRFDRFIELTRDGVKVEVAVAVLDRETPVSKDHQHRRGGRPKATLAPEGKG